jgi:hypothetical protein
MAIKKKYFPGSAKYWEKRYAGGRNSGSGSYGHLAEFKAEIINGFVKDNNIQTVIEFGCGDGNQLSLSEYPNYIGFDVSATAVKMCQNLFKNDKTKGFFILDKYNRHAAELTLSLDVIFHLIEDHVFESYMQRLFEASSKYVIIYSCNFDDVADYHEKPRNFTRYVAEKMPQWELVNHIPNKYPYDKNNRNDTSRSDFYIFMKTAG